MTISIPLNFIPFFIPLMNFNCGNFNGHVVTLISIHVEFYLRT